MKKMFALAAVALAVCAHAQDFPAGKPVTIVVPFAAGGPTDRVARDLAEALRKPLGGASVIIDNVPGAGSSIGAAKVARATAARANIFFMEVSVKVKKKNQGARDGTRLSSVGGCHSGLMWQPFLPSVS